MQPPTKRAVIAYGTDAAGCVLAPPGVCPPACPGDPCPGILQGSSFLVVYKTSGGTNPPVAGTFDTLCPWPGNPTPAPANVVAVDWDPYAQEAYVLTITANGPGFGEVWRTDLATYTIRTPIVPPAPPSCSPTQPMRFFDLAVYRTAPTGGQTLVAVAMNTFFGIGNTGNVDVFDPVTGASVIPGGPYCYPNITYRRIDAGLVQSLNLPGFAAGYNAVVMPGFTPFFPNWYETHLLAIPPTDNNWFFNPLLRWNCSTGTGPEIVRPLSVSINTQIPTACGVPQSELVVGGLQECGGLSAPSHSYVQQNASAGIANFVLRHATGASLYNQLATDVVVTAGQVGAPAPTYFIQYASTGCNSPVSKFWWFARECNGGNPVALPDLPWTNVQPVDVAAIQ